MTISRFFSPLRMPWLVLAMLILIILAGIILPDLDPTPVRELLGIAHWYGK